MLFLLVLLVAAVGGIIGLKLKLPAGAMLGAMIAVAIFTVTTDIQATPAWFKVVAQIIAGAYIGTGMTKESIAGLKRLLAPAAFLIAGMLVINFITGMLLYAISPLDLCTSMFSCVPGGMTDVAIIADDLGANAPVVSVFQICRMVATMSTIPFIILKLSGRTRSSGDPNTGGKKEKKPFMTAEEGKKFALTVLFATIFGLAGYFSRMPAGTMIFSVVGISFTKVKYNIGYIPMRVKQGAQILSGSFIGARITFATVQLIISVWYSIAIIVAVFLSLCLLLGYLLSKLFKLDITTALFCSAPAGLSEMALIANDVGADGPNVAVLQLARFLGIVSIAPSLIKIMLSAVGWAP